MNSKQYNNIIDWTLKHEQSAQTDDSLKTARTIFNNMGVALPSGTVSEVFETLKTNDYMGWRTCTVKEAQERVADGTAVVGINDNRIVVLSADDEDSVEQNESVLSLSNETSVNDISNLTFYSYSCGGTGGNTGGYFDPNVPSYPFWYGVRCSWSSSNDSTWSWSEPKNDDYNSTSRVFHLGLDLTGTYDNIHPILPGTVCDIGFNSENGNYVIIRHSFDNKTIYSFYLHLESINVNKGATVSKIETIGIKGDTGSSSEGPHLHLGIANRLCENNGDYLGYSKKFSGNKRDIGEITYYNPKYVIDNCKIPI